MCSRFHSISISLAALALLIGQAVLAQHHDEKQGVGHGKDQPNTLSVSSDEAHIKLGSKVLGKVHKGDQVRVIRIKGDWYGVEVNGKKGWIHKRHLGTHDAPGHHAKEGGAEEHHVVDHPKTTDHADIAKDHVKHDKAHHAKTDSHPKAHHADQKKHTDIAKDHVKHDKAHHAKTDSHPKAHHADQKKHTDHAKDVGDQQTDDSHKTSDKPKHDLHKKHTDQKTKHGKDGHSKNKTRDSRHGKSDTPKSKHKDHEQDVKKDKKSI